MDTGIRDFCLKHKEKIENDKDIKENAKVFPLRDYRNRIKFRVNIQKSSPGTMIMGPYNGKSLFELDSEDLEYLYNKYSKRIEAEMDKNIEEVKNSYKDSLE